MYDKDMVEWFAKRQAAIADETSPEASATRMTTIRRCLGNMARGNLYEDHPDVEPGGYDVGFGMIPLNPTAPFKTFAEAQEFALMFQQWVGKAIEHHVANNHDSRKVRDFTKLREVDVFSGTDAYQIAERFLKTKLQPSYENKLILWGEPVRCAYGWLVTWNTSAFLHGDKSRPARGAKPLLVVPPKGEVHILSLSAVSTKMALELLVHDFNVPRIFEEGE